MVFSSEEIVRVTVNGFENFLKTLLTPEDYQRFETYKKDLFPSWNHLWAHLHPWLCKTPLNSMQECILSLLDQFPGSDSFRGYLQNSLVLHDEIWNKVYENLLIAKGRLTC